MKVVFLLDNNEYVEVAPDKLQVRQLQAGLAALGTEVTVPVNGEDGKPELDEKGQPKTQSGFRPFINYNVNLRVPQANLQGEIDVLKKELGEKLAEQAAQSAAPLPAPTAVAVDDKPATKSNGVAKKPAKAAAKRKGNL
jgi:hypothetical protein